MKTEFLSLGHIAGNSRMFELLPYCDVDKVAKGALKATKKRRSIYTPRMFYKIYRILAHLLPDPLMTKLGKT